MSPGRVLVPQCPCDLGLNYDACCGRFHSGQSPPTAVALMRSRYTAFAFADLDYLLRTWHSSTRPDELEIDRRHEWLALEIRSATGGIYNTAGTVEFVARYRRGRQVRELHELSRFVREDGNWRYVDGLVGSQNSTERP